MLNLKECQYLKDLGMEQEIEEGDWVWSDQNTKWTRLLVGPPATIVTPRVFPPNKDMKYIRIPSLTELLAFVKEIAIKRWGIDLTTDFHEDHKRGWYAVIIKEEHIYIDFDGEMVPQASCEDFSDSPELAVYKLIEKVVAKGDSGE